MDRRTLLAGAGLAIGPSVCGCLGTDTPEADGDDDGTESMETAGDENGDPERENSSGEGATENRRVDDPPHAIDPPEPPEGSEMEWNDDYLGEQMETDPSLRFTTIPVPTGWIREAGLGGGDSPDEEAFQVRVVTDADGYDDRFLEDEMDAETRDRLASVDFEESVLVIVESGFGSSSVEHRWSRVEGTDKGVHLHGYHTDPYEQLDDLGTRVSVLEVERPSTELAVARVFLTVDEDRRVRFDSTEGVVRLAPSDAP